MNGSASSIDGRDFSFELPLPPSGIRAGTYVQLDLDGGAAIGLVEHAELDTGARRIVGDGTVLATLADDAVHLGAAAPFAGAALALASPPTVAALHAARLDRRVPLPIGRYEQDAGATEAAIDAAGFGRHTFVCGQSGSGKTYALGVLLEQLLLGTGLRLLILDPNSDFVRLGEARDGADDAAARTLAANVTVFSNRTDNGAAHPIRTRFDRFPAWAAAALLQLDPLADREEYVALDDAMTDIPHGFTLPDLLRRLGDAETDAVDAETNRRLALRIRALGVADWQLWQTADNDELVSRWPAGDGRCAVVDLGSVADRAEREAISTILVTVIWQARHGRRPLLLVADEAHHLFPAEPETAFGRRTTELGIAIAGEGRKFGCFLLCATQRPQKLHTNVVSQCDNLLLMRMNSRADLAGLAAAFSFVPESLLALSTGFGLGEGLLAGPIAGHPLLVRFGSRLSHEGGADVPRDWLVPQPG